MNLRKVLLVLLTVAVLAGLGVWSYSTGSSSTPRSTSSSTRTTVNLTGTSAQKGGKASTTTAVPAPTTTVVHDPAAYANALFGYWTRRDRVSAAKIATPTVVKQLFAHFWHATDGWTAHGCQGAAGSTYCTWTRPSRHLVLQVRNATGGLPILVVAVQRTQ